MRIFEVLMTSFAFGLIAAILAGPLPAADDVDVAKACGLPDATVRYHRAWIDCQDARAQEVNARLRASISAAPARVTVAPVMVPAPHK